MMDMGDGRFQMLSEEQMEQLRSLQANPEVFKQDVLFEKGKIVQLKDSKFMIMDIRSRGRMTLKLLPKGEH